MDMLNCFFSNRYKDRGDLFEGLSIWEEEKYHSLQGTYPVIFLSFAWVKEENAEAAKCKIKELIARLYEDLTGVWDAINNDSEVGTWQGDADNFKIKMAEAAFAGQGEDAFKQIVADTNAKWNATRDANADLAAYLEANG